MSADHLIKALALAPHPEGGYYRETFRDPRCTPDGRSVSTAIYFLLAAGEISRWHKVDAAEIWHWYAGAPLELSVAPDDSSPPTRMILSADLASGGRPQLVVPAGHWQQARSMGSWTLAGCTVAPGFEFAGFVMSEVGFEPGGVRKD
ncbi:MAG: cupin domain-containing protein [Hyphomicrobiaceae bacterium]